MLVVSDHGSAIVHTHLDLPDWFRAQGVPTLSHPVLWEREPRAAVMVAGNASAMVCTCVAPPGLRPHRWPIEQLRRPEAFGLALGSGGRPAEGARRGAPGSRVGRRRVGGLDPEGSAYCSGAGTPGHLAYRPLEGDPLAVGGDRGVARCP